MLENRSSPRPSVIPVLAYAGVREAAEWLCRAFGFRERLRIGEHRVQLVYGDGALIVTELGDIETRPAAHSVHVRVEGAERHHEMAARSGAHILSPPTDYPYGERQYSAEDPAGHHWTFSETIADVAPEEWGGTSVG